MGERKDTYGQCLVTLALIVLCPIWVPCVLMFMSYCFFGLGILLVYVYFIDSGYGFWGIIGYGTLVHIVVMCVTLSFFAATDYAGIN